MPLKVGVSFDENLYGTYHPIGQAHDRRTLMFRLRATSDNLARTLLWDRRVELEGLVEAEGLAHHATARGDLVIQPILRRRMSYRLEFRSDAGELLRYEGTKTIRHLEPLSTWTTIKGNIFDLAGQRRFESEARFDLTELLPFLQSYRLLPART